MSDFSNGDSDDDPKSGPRANSGDKKHAFAKKRKNAQLTQAADVLQGLLQNSKSHLSDGFIRWRLEQKWVEVVGETIAQQTLPCAYDRGTLFIWVKHPAWAQQLRFFQDSIRDKVNAHLEQQWAKKIVFTLNRRAATTELKS